MPLLRKQKTVFDDHCANPCQFVIPEPLGHSQFDWVQPIFCHLVAMFDMDVWWLRAFLTEKEKPEAV